MGAQTIDKLSLLGVQWTQMRSGGMKGVFGGIVLLLVAVGFLLEPFNLPAQYAW